MNKKTLLTLALCLYGLTTQINAESISEDITKNVACATPAEQSAEKEKMALTWEEKSTLDLIKSLNKNNQLNRHYLQSFVESPCNYLNRNATSVEELNLCDILQKQKQILTKEINDIKIKRVYNGNYSRIKWLKLCYGAGVTGLFSAATEKTYTDCLNQYLNNITTILEPFAKEPIQNSDEIAKKLANNATPSNLTGFVLVGGAAYCSYRIYKLYQYYTEISTKEKEIKLLDTMIATIQEIEQSE